MLLFESGKTNAVWDTWLATEEYYYFRVLRILLVATKVPYGAWTYSNAEIPLANKGTETQEPNRMPIESFPCTCNLPNNSALGS